MKFDSLDRRIIYLIGKNSRLSYSSLARALKTSREVITFRINRLIKKGIYHKSVSVINVNILGKKTISLLIKVVNNQKEDRKNLEDFLLKNKSFIYVQKTFGDWDYLANALVEDIEESHLLLDKIFSKFQCIEKIKELFILEEYGPGWSILIPDDVSLPKFPVDRAGFTKYFKQRNTQLNQKYNADKIDKKIISILEKDARTKIIDISKIAKIDYKTVISRIKKLIKSGVISEFGLSTNLQELQIYRKSLLLKIKNHSKNSKKIKDFFYNLKTCSRFWTYYGYINLRINISIKTIEDFKDTIKKIQNFFGDDLIEINSLEIIKQIKI